MKKLSLLTAVLLLALSGIYAQKNIMEVNHSVDIDVPMEVLLAIEDGYPGLHIHEHLIKPAPVEKKKQRVVAEPITLSKYKANYKARDYWKNEMYTKKGKMFYSKERSKNVALPRAVYNYIGKEYNGWLIKKTVAVKIIDLSSKAPRKVIYYKVLLQDGKKKQRVRLDEDGNIYFGKRF